MIERFPANSRYHGTPTAELNGPDGRSLVYLRRRFVPDPARFVTLQEYQVMEGDRIDRMAATVLGDPEQFWRLPDANGSLKPGELEELGRRIRLTLPEGMAGLGDA
ncbi:LysM domain-containing protein [Aquipseudomonas ullengensis]|uniref:LysM domain-containing protein n=1 Tax=Aquipseudomonas ullengensis TaxID=2759166 RepID=A0A7W4LP91_9GAMM|nr:LysM domain-containing protein [Pseudomonas ullengensis]MBB2496655.1 LysM domain-containing protein [Pseudomonas ullengensis]